jgi:hypothetical protein
MKKFLIPIALVALGFALGYYAGRRSMGLRGTMNPGPVPLPQQPASPETKLGPWAASFHIPGSVQMPDKTPVIKCEFKAIKFGYLYVTITNLTSPSYLVRYNIYGYDAKRRRVSDGEDQFAIGRHESVVRKVMLNSRSEGFLLESGKTFWVQMTLED